MSWVTHFTEYSTEQEGYVLTKDQLALLVEEYELETHSRYTVCRSKQNYGINMDDIKYGSMKIFWADPKASQESVRPAIPDDGTPFIILGSCTMACHQGNKRKPKKPQKLPPGEKSRKSPISKKIDCPSQIRIRRVMKFTQYEIYIGSSTEDAKTMIVPLQEKLCDEAARSKVKMEDRYYVHLPDHTSHENHKVGAGIDIHMILDKRVSGFIQEKVMMENVSNSQEMMNMVHKYVRTVLFKDKPLPPMSHTRYWPSMHQVRDHMRMTNMKRRVCALDEEEILKCVTKWRHDYPEDSIELRLRAASLKGSNHSKDYCQSSDNPYGASRKKFIFVQQTHWQRKMLCLYGDEMCLLDVYRPTKYALPLYFLVVPTNHMFVAVASFIVESESKGDIEEALLILRSWNPNWVPGCIMSDFSENEIAAIESIFKNSRTEALLCDFHRLHSWKRWVAVKTNRVGVYKESVLNLLKNIAESYTEDEYQENLQSFRENESFKTNQTLQRWFEKWIANASRWVKMFRHERYILVDTNSGVEGINGIIKQMFLRGFSHQKTQTVSELATIMITRFLPFSHKRYCLANKKSQTHVVPYNLPFLHNRPAGFVDHVLKRWEEAQRTKYLIQEDNFGLFHIMSATSRMSNQIRINNGYGMPSCTCLDWRSFHYPCKHILAAITLGAFSWEGLPNTYTASPFLLIDSYFVSVFYPADVLYDSENRNCEVENGIDELPAEKFRDYLKKLESLSYLSYNEEVFERLNDNLKQYVEDLSNTCAMEGPYLRGPEFIDHSTTFARKSPKKKPVKRKSSVILNEDDSSDSFKGQKVHINRPPKVHGQMPLSMVTSMPAPVPAPIPVPIIKHPEQSFYSTLMNL